MNEAECLAQMVPPGQRRPGVWSGGVLQIWITRACDKACFGCTQGSNLGGRPGMITAEQFAEACDSLQDYFGVVGMFGGNPAMHPQFDLLCAIMRDKIPFERRGLWCNNLLGKGDHARRTFNPAVSNLNVHLDQEAYDEFRRDWPEAGPFGLDKDSRHSPVHGSMVDLAVPEAERWEKISRCDINQRWSAMIGVFRDQLRGWFCEVAGAQAMLRQHDPEYPDTGLPIEPGWWQRPMQDFAQQVRVHCHNCLVPLKGHGAMAQGVGEVEQTTQSYAGIFRPKKHDRDVQIVTTIAGLGEPLARSTDYVQNGDIK